MPSKKNIGIVKIRARNKKARRPLNFSAGITPSNRKIKPKKTASDIAKTSKKTNINLANNMK